MFCDLRGSGGHKVPRKGPITIPLIARLSKKFRYPSWIVYDITFRQEAADTGTANWAKVDSSIHTQCFTGMSLCEEGWCALCTALDHTTP